MEPRPTACIKLTPRRIAALQLIADHGATLSVSSVGVGGRRVVSGDGTRIRTDVYDTLAAAGLLVRDTSTSLERGQAVGLTDAGHAALRGGPVAEGSPAERRI